MALCINLISEEASYCLGSRIKQSA